MLSFLTRPRQVALAISTRIDEKLDAVAAFPPPPVAISIQKVLAVSIAMQSAAVASISLHAFVLLAVGFTIFDPSRFATPHNVMDVVLVNSKSQSRPTSADALAQANLDGGGNTDEKRRAKTPLPAMAQSSVADEVQCSY